MPARRGEPGTSQYIMACFLINDSFTDDISEEHEDEVGGSYAEKMPTVKQEMDRSVIEMMTVTEAKQDVAKPTPIETVKAEPAHASSDQTEVQPKSETAKEDNKKDNLLEQSVSDLSESDEENLDGSRSDWKMKRKKRQSKEDDMDESQTSPKPK